MRQNSWRNSPKRKTEGDVSITPDAISDETSFMARRLAAPRDWNDTKETAKARLARSLRVSVHTVHRLIYGRNKRIEAHLYLRLKHEYEAWERRQLAAAALDLETARATRGQIERGRHGDDAVDESHSAALRGALCPPPDGKGESS